MITNEQQQGIPYNTDDGALIVHDESPDIVLMRWLEHQTTEELRAYGLAVV